MRKGFCVWFTGLSGAGKTTLSKAFQAALGRPVTILDGDEVRQSLCADLGYSKADRDENVKRIAFVAKQIVEAGGIALVACISPYAEARKAARASIGAFVEVYLDETSRNRFGGEYEAGTADLINPTVNEIIDHLTQMGYIGTALMLGRWQPWHDGHTALFREALKEGRVCIGVRREPRDAMGFDEVKSRIEAALSEYAGRFDVIQMPNITNIVYGRSVGYGVTRVELPAEIESISATKIRAAAV